MLHFILAIIKPYFTSWLSFNGTSERNGVSFGLIVRRGVENKKVLGKTEGGK